MRNWRAIAVFGGAGILLSLLAGVFSGNPFGVVLLRALLSGVASAGVGFGLLVLVDRFLPEVGGRGPARQGLGEHVDITVSGDGLPGGGAEAAGASGLEGDSEPRLDLDAPDAPGLEGVGGLEAVAEDREGDRPEGDGTVDAIELGSLEDGGLDDAAALPGDGAATSGRISVGGRAGIGVQEQDPDVVARALRTMMKRDEEG